MKIESQKFENIYIQSKNASCKGSDQFSAHPLIYLDLSKNYSATCPYCSRHFVFQEKNKHIEDEKH